MTGHSATRKKAFPWNVLHTLLFSILPPLPWSVLHTLLFSILPPLPWCVLHTLLFSNPPPPPTLHKITNDTGHGGQCCKLPSQTETTTVSNANLFIIYFIITQNRTVSTNGTHLLHGVYSTVNHMLRVLYVHDSLITPWKPSIINAP